MNLRLPLMVVYAFLFCLSANAQNDSTLVQIAADTLSSDMQEGGLSVAAIGHYNDGLEHFQNNQPELAIADFTKALAEEPNFPKAIYNRAAAYLSLKDYSNVIADLSTYITLADTAKEAYYLRARALHISGFGEEALADYKVAIEKRVERENSFLYSAELNFRMANYNDAEAAYSGAISENPQNAVAFHDRGSTRKLLDNLDGAAGDYNNAIKLNPRMTMAYMNLAGVYRKQNKLDKAMSEYNQAIRLEPNNVLAHNNRGYVYFLQEKYDEAAKDFEKAIDLDPTYAFAHNNLASTLIKQEKYQEAITSAGKAIVLDSNYGFAYLNRGIAREMVRDIPGACADWEKAEAMNIKNAAIYQSGSCKY